MPDRDELIRERAYELWEEAGRPFGHEHEFWAKAAKEIGEDELTRDGTRRVAR